MTVDIAPPATDQHAIQAGLVTGWNTKAGWRGPLLRTISPIKLLIALGCLVAAAYLLGPTLFFTESNEAVTNAPIDVVRSPIAGVVTTLLAEPGRSVRKDDVIADIFNDYWDPTAMLQAGNRLIEATQHLDEARQEASALRVQQVLLREAHALWLSSMDTVLTARRVQARSALVATRARLETATETLQRYGNLSKFGAVNLQRLDEVKLAAVTVGQEVSGATAELAKIEAEGKALASGLLLDGTERSTTSQRLDDIAIRLAMLDATQVATAVEVVALRDRLLIRERQRDRETRIELRAGSAGTIWRVFNAPGDRIAANSTVANVIDCSRTNVTAIFSQRDVGALRRGRRVSVRVAGFTDPLGGVIADVNGYYDSDTRAAEAITIRAIDKGSVLVHVQLDAAVPDCLIGLHANVRLD